MAYSLERKKLCCLYSQTTWSCNTETPKKSTENLLKLIREFSKVSEYKVNTLNTKALVFLCISNKQLENKILKYYNSIKPMK